MERDNEQLRSEMRSVKSGDKATVDNVHQLLTVARLDLDQKRKELSQKNTELDRLRAKLEETQVGIWIKPTIKPRYLKTNIFRLVTFGR